MLRSHAMIAYCVICVHFMVMMCCLHFDLSTVYINCIRHQSYKFSVLTCLKKACKSVDAMTCLVFAAVGGDADHVSVSSRHKHHVRQ